MNTIAYEIEGQRTELEFPSTLAEMNGEQLIAAVRNMLSGEDIPLADLAVLTGVPTETLELFSPFQLYSLREMFTFLHDADREALNFREWKIPTITVNGTTWYGPMSNFANITWEEFVYVDQCFLNGLHRPMVAALFRPERDGYNGETDRRIPFTTFGTANRYELLGEPDPALQTAILLNYVAMRRASLEETYTQLFPQHGSEPDDTHEADFTDEDPEAADTPSGNFSWTGVHRNLLGDNIQDEEKYLHLNVHTVLNRLNQLILDNKRHH